MKRVSVTELQEFLRCRRMWSLSSANARSLVPKGEAAWELYIGSCFHHGVEAQALGYDPIASAQAWQNAEVKRLAEEHVSRYGKPLSMESRLQVGASNKMSRTILEGYFKRYGWDNPVKPYRYVCPEVTIQLPFEGLDGAVLVGTIDGVAVHPETQAVVLVEHKTYGQKPDTSKFHVDHQMTGYAAIFEALTGIQVDGVLYDGVAKKLPRIPTVLKNGSISKEWIDTTDAEYVKAILSVNGDPNDPQYADFRKRLQERDAEAQTPFHTRKLVRFSSHAKRMWLENARAVIEDMMNPDTKMYPNYPWTGCWDCRMQDLCEVLQTGVGDFDALVAERYKVDTYGTQKALRSLTPRDVWGLPQLLEAAETWKADVRSLGKETFVSKDSAGIL